MVSDRFWPICGATGPEAQGDSQDPAARWNQFNHGTHEFPLEVPSGYVKIAIENGHRNSEFSHYKWWISIVMLNYQRVPIWWDMMNWLVSWLVWWLFPLEVPIYGIYIPLMLMNWFSWDMIDTYWYIDDQEMETNLRCWNHGVPSWPRPAPAASSERADAAASAASASAAAKPAAKPAEIKAAEKAFEKAGGTFFSFRFAFVWVKNLVLTTCFPIFDWRRLGWKAGINLDKAGGSTDVVLL